MSPFGKNLLLTSCFDGFWPQVSDSCWKGVLYGSKQQLGEQPYCKSKQQNNNSYYSKDSKHYSINTVSCSVFNGENVHNYYSIISVDRLFIMLLLE